MTAIQKHEIVQAIERQRAALGSLKAVANKTGVSEALISQMINENWDKISDKAWRKVGVHTGWKTEGWQLVETTNSRALFAVFEDAKAESLFIPVSHRAGSGKTASSKAYAGAHYKDAVFYIQCREWSAKKFLDQLCQTLGIDKGRGYMTADDLVQRVVDFFHQRAGMKPLLIIDEADKLRPSGLRALIPIYNECEEELGVVILGTENLEKEIKRGVRMNKKGYDEIDSRFGRRFVHLIGATLKDVQMICTANGINTREVQKRIFDESGTVNIMHHGKPKKVVPDLRRIKRAIKSELLKVS